MSLYFLIYSKEGNTAYLIDCWAVNEVRCVRGSMHSLAHNRCLIKAISFLEKCWCGGLFCWVSRFFGRRVQEKFWETTDCQGGSVPLDGRKTLAGLPRCSREDSPHVHLETEGSSLPKSWRPRVSSSPPLYSTLCLFPHLLLRHFLWCLCVPSSGLSTGCSLCLVYCLP